MGKKGTFHAKKTKKPEKVGEKGPRIREESYEGKNKRHFQHRGQKELRERGGKGGEAHLRKKGTAPLTQKFN